MSYTFVNLPCYQQNNQLENSVEREIAEAMSYLRVKQHVIKSTMPVYQAINNLVINAIYSARPVNIPRIAYKGCLQHQYDTVQGLSESMLDLWSNNSCGSTIRFFPNYYCVDVDYVYNRENGTEIATDSSACKYSAVINITPRSEEMTKWPNVILDNVEIITRAIRARFFPGESWKTSSETGYNGASISYTKKIPTDMLDAIINDRNIKRYGISAELGVSLQIPHSNKSDKISESCGLKRVVKKEERVVYKFSCEGDNE